MLQPNFRGSTGYGRQYVEKGNGQWGRGMQDDIDDGVKWLRPWDRRCKARVHHGRVVRRLCGEWAAIRNPDIYRCAISLAGVSDVAAQLRYDRKFLLASRYYRDWRERVQGSDGITGFISPAKRAADLKVPILIAQATPTPMSPDPVQKPGRCADQARPPAEYYVYKGEGHGFTKPGRSDRFSQEGRSVSDQI